MILADLRLVVSIAKRYSNRSASSDLVQEGNIGLMKAVSLSTAEEKFSTYDMVDSAVHHACPRGSGQNDPHPRASRRDP